MSEQEKAEFKQIERDLRAILDAGNTTYSGKVFNAAEYVFNKIKSARNEKD